MSSKSNLLYKDTVYTNIVLENSTISFLKLGFLNFISLKELECLICFGKIFRSTALLKL